MMTVFPSPLLGINTTAAPSPRLLQHNLSILNLEEGGGCCGATMASATLLCRFLGTCGVSVCRSPQRSQVCVFPRGYGSTSNAAGKHIHLPNANSEKRKRKVCPSGEDRGLKVFLN